MLTSQLLTPPLQTVAWPLYLGGIALAAYRAPWFELFSDSRRQHLFFGTAFALFLLWMIERTFECGISIHFLGVTAATLLLDAPFAVLAGMAAQMALIAFGKQDLAALAVNGILLVLIPVAITRFIATRVERLRPTNLFVYIFMCGFFPAAFIAFIYALLNLGLLWLSGAVMPPWIEDYPIYILLIPFPEGFINGTIISALVVYYPEWLETFNRTRYLQAPPEEE